MSNAAGTNRWYAPVPVGAVASWLVPGTGYLLLGQMARGLTIGITVLFLFVSGVLIGGLHVVDPPAFAKPTPGETIVQQYERHMTEVLQKPPYIGQFLAGIIGIYAGKIGPTQPASHARLADIGALYTAVAGVLNLLAIIDASHRAAQPGAA
jgi:hypothetical protein